MAEFTGTGTATTSTDTLTLAEMLAEVETAISKVLRAQEYRIGDKHFKRADLEDLKAWRKELKHEISATDGRTNNSLRMFVGRSGR